MLQILYATDENADFAPPADAQEPAPDDGVVVATPENNDGVVDGVQDEQAF